MLTVSKTGDDDTLQTALIPGGSGGPVFIRAVDSDRGRNDPVADSLNIDYMAIRSGI